MNAHLEAWGQYLNSIVLAISLEDRYGIQIDDADFETNVNLRDLARTIHQQGLLEKHGLSLADIEAAILDEARTQNEAPLPDISIETPLAQLVLSIFPSRKDKQA